MLGMYFAALSEDKVNPGRVALKTGRVKADLGASRWLLEFDARGFKFANVFAADALTGFAFFDTPESRQAFLAELQAQIAPPSELPPGVTVEPPPSDEDL